MVSTHIRHRHRVRRRLWRPPVAQAPCGSRVTASPAAARAPGGTPCARGRALLAVLLEPIKRPVNMVQTELLGRRKAMYPPGLPHRTGKPGLKDGRHSGENTSEEAAWGPAGSVAAWVLRSGRLCGTGPGVVVAPNNSPHSSSHHPNHLLPNWTELRTLMATFY